MKKALIVATTASMIDLFNMSNICILQKMGYEVATACNFKEGNTTSQERIKEFKTELKQRHVKCYEIGFPRSPFKIRRMHSAYVELKNLVIAEKYNLIHCHTPVGGFLTRIVAAKVKQLYDVKIIYTAHGFHFFKGAPLQNWILYFPVEWLCAFWTDVLVTINKEDYQNAKRWMKAKQIEYIPGIGINVNRFRLLKNQDRAITFGIGTQDMLCTDLVLLSVGELNSNKNHEMIICALAKIKNKNIHYVIAGQGKLKDYLIELSRKLGIKNRVHLLGYRKDIETLYKCADIYVLPSLREGLNVSLMEAMASGLPVICSKIRGNTDLIINGEGGILCTATSESEYISAINELMDNKEKRLMMGEQNRRNILKYDTEIIMKKTIQIYSEIKHDNVTSRADEKEYNEKVLD